MSMLGGVIEGERGVDAHCGDCPAEWRGYTELATWTQAADHVRQTGHGVMMHWRLFLSPFSPEET